MELGNVSQPVYGPGPKAPGSSTPGLVGMVHGFLRLVQPNALPIELIADFGQPQDEEAIGKQVQELLFYELGFLVCMAIGLLFIILVPLVGCCFCCCRCCGNCGGRMYQKQGQRMSWRRRVLWASLLLVSALLLAGDVCSFISNSRFSQAVRDTFPNVNNTLDNVHTYLASIPQQINFIVDSSDVPLGHANRSLQDIGPKLGGMITSGIRSSTDRALGSLQSLLQGMETLAAAFSSIAGTRLHLEELQSNHSRRLASLRDGLNQTLRRCGHPCSNVSLSGLAFSTNFSMIPSVERQLEALGDVSGSNITADLEKVNSTLDMTPAKVQEQSRDVVTKTQGQLGLIRQEIRSLQEQLPLLDVEESVGAFVGNATSVLEEYREPIIALDGLRWSVCIVLCCVVLLVVLCNTVGLLLGPLGLKESVLPTQRSSLSNVGGNFFMAGVGFSFIFSWLLMLLVVITFVLGGNIYMLICESWRSQQLFQLLDTPGLIPGFNLSELLGQEGDTANFSEMYRQCQRDAALWQTLHLDQSVSLDELLNISQYTGDISAAFEKMNITLSPISLLSQSQRDLLLNTSQDGQPPDFTPTLELDQNVTQGSLLDLAAELEQLADKVGMDVKEDLKADASKLRELDKEMQMSFSGLLQSLKEDIHLVQSRAAQLEAQTKAALDKASETQQFLERETANIIKNETWAFLEELLDFFETYILWAKSRLTGDVARCKPIAETLDNVETITCDYILDSLNAFWFSLGWCTFFLLPSIILGVRLAKFYRRMDVADVYRNEDLEMPPMFNFYKIPRPSTRH
ncbi:prominin-1-A-like isoform X1 [Falco biarmicus]|uniref:prominin-1-A-like isoform X1 n=1 Tax=Falco rusticolus TaxID=120794 RepID=UPI001886773D|nr:prominin-1-A-like isoform X1 [Falco rusticolus]XP_037256484.1 prominin-1-A-like isoform X1 [Falco rusticolus]XP_056206820.1 prominin-1-A-like isoform X1 [Falco biarmicus]XP_056206822.1 prominin-1-A-like isoform X1 [Falco biarmicus]